MNSCSASRFSSMDAGTLSVSMPCCRKSEKLGVTATVMAEVPYIIHDDGWAKTCNNIFSGHAVSASAYRLFSVYMRAVSIIGIGKTRFGVLKDQSILDLAVEAARKCLKNGNVVAAQVEAFYLGNFAGPSFVGQNHLAPYVGAALGLEGVPATRIEAACASSGSAFFHAFSAVASGIYDLVLAAGVEKMTSQPAGRVTEILASAGDLGGEVKAGATFPAMFAMIARRHMHQFGTTREHLAAVAVKNHANGAKNP